MYNLKMTFIKRPKHVVVPYVENTLYSTNKYRCVRPVHTLYIRYFIEHYGNDEPHGCVIFQWSSVIMYLAAEA